MTYLKRPYTMCVTTFQMSVLLPFNESLTLSHGSLSQATQLPLTDLTPALQSLVDAKVLLTESEKVSGRGLFVM